jgi:CHAD domain-containing protein
LIGWVDAAGSDDRPADTMADMPDSTPAGGPDTVGDAIPDAAPSAPAERHLEVETKLDVPDGFRMPQLAEDPVLRALGVVAVTAPVARRLDARYYDTAVLDLLRSRFTMRRRAGGDDAGWHLKLPAGAGARTELRLPLSGTGSAGDDVPGSFAELVRGAARGRALVPVARLRTVRTARHLLDAAGAPLVEIADDEVTGAGLLPGGPGEQRWREIEVEIEAGTPDLLAAVVQALAAAGALPAAAASKLGRLLAPVERAVTGSAGHRPAGSADPTSAGAVLVDYLSQHRDLLISADIRLRADGTDGGTDDAAADGTGAEVDFEAPHDARTAARRIRAVLTVNRALFRQPAAQEVADRLRQIGRAISGVRDLDVVRARFAAWADAEPDLGESDEATQRLERRLTTLRAVRRRALRQVLDSPDYLRLLREIDVVLADPPGSPAAAEPGDTLAGPITEAWRRWRDHAGRARAIGAAVEASPDADDSDRDALMHRVRKEAKAVRYAAEAAAGAGGAFGTAMAEFTGSLEQLQDVLGAHQDAVTALAVARSIGAAPDLDDSERAVLNRWQRAEFTERARARARFAALWPQLPAVPPG